MSHFLTDYVRSTAFTGFPSLGIQWQRMESEALRRAHGMGAKQKGVLIRRVNPTSHAAGLLAPDDVLMAWCVCVRRGSGARDKRGARAASRASAHTLGRAFGSNWLHRERTNNTRNSQS